MAAGQESPFYIKVTPVREEYQTPSGPQSIDLPLVTLPPGTVLFRGLTTPIDAQDALYFYKDFIGLPEGDMFVCVNPTKNTFFYPFPFVPFGVHEQGQHYDMIQAFVLVHPLTVVCMISPSEMVRGEAQRYLGTAPLQRCSTVPAEVCHTLSNFEKKALEYDNCLLPDYQVRSGTRGWMAIADLDSINSKKIKKEGKTAKETPMGSYVKGLDSRMPGVGSQVLGWTYTDKHHHVGFPEIAVFPYKNHPGNRVIQRRCQYERVALTILEEEARADNLMFLPLAAFTKRGIVDFTSGLFKYDRLEYKDEERIDMKEVRASIERHMAEYLKKIQTAGISLPYYCQGKLCFDTRTGFFVLSQIVPEGLMVPVPAAEAGAGGAAGAAVATAIPYKKLLMLLDSTDARKRVEEYMLIFRTFLHNKFMNKYGLEKGFGALRAMVFSRPPVLKDVFSELEIAIPGEFKAQLARAAKMYQKDTGILPKSKPVAAAAAAEPGPAVAAAAASTTPPYYGGLTPPAAAAPTASTPPYYGGLTPPLPNAKGGARKTRGVSKKKTRSTRRRRSSPRDVLKTVLSFGNRLWKAHASKKH
jgi:hypothetical protein